ncbi:two-partner secretion domain-containing protein [unidentified bacterial endosymbiont]|uniref:two-partner secretion domain-containing protein n=1 Tax=unidentified bacterial endosymbiont TaxID=2355 RepID=UPI00209DE2E7|nr:filamentous hemagglutinin N-terminal domain-containing protein [unidentified bacterial endosymbiont]
MNQRCFRVIFNRPRGQAIVVGELARTPGHVSSAGSVPRQSRWRCCTLPLVLIVTLGWMPGADATIVADANAPSAQQPNVVTAPNGASPLVNIQTPNAAGISHNTYSRFDVEPAGAILNNSRQAVHTQLAGTIAGNPHLTTGPAQIILNEVNSSNPSLLRGFIEVAGQRAHVVVANPSGIYVKGGGFINTSGVTLTTGTPQLQNGHLDSYRVIGGLIKIDGEGLDARSADYTQIFAQAVQLNAAVHAKKLMVTTGNNLVKVDNEKATPIASNTEAPEFALDVAKLGGMYAHHIFIVGTENGVGMRNSGTLQATSGNLKIDNQGWLTNHGNLQSYGDLQIKLNGNDHTQSFCDPQVRMAGSKRTVRTTIAADATAPKTQQPSVSMAVNKVPLVDIQTPNAAGVSYNIYSRFDVERQGAVLNNSRDTVETRLAGTIAANANLTNGPARLILNEINSSDPSYLRGALEVAGQGAQVIIANPSGIYVEGAGFINTSGAMLMTGKPQFREGHLDSYCVTGGIVHISGKGLDTRGTDHTQISAQAVQLNTKSHAEKLTITTGNNLIKTNNGHNTPIASSNQPSAFNLSVLRQGGIYAKQIFIVGTQVGTEIRNDGILQTKNGDLNITNQGCLTSRGVLQSGRDLKVKVIGRNHTFRITSSELRAASELELDTEGKLDIRDSKIIGHAKGEVTLSRSDCCPGLLVIPLLDHNNINIKRLQTDSTSLAAPRGLNNFGLLQAGHQLTLQANAIRNHAEGVINATHTRVLTDKGESGWLNNRGLIDGQTTEVRAHSLNNLGSGVIYGDQLLLGAHTLTNHRGQVNANNKAIIAARQQLTIGAQHILNQEGALIMSAGPMAVGERLDEQQQLVGQTLELNNSSATIDVQGDAHFNITTLNNSDIHFKTHEVQVSHTQGHRRVERSPHIDRPNDYTAYDYNTTITETRIAQQDPAKLLIGGNLRLEGHCLNNDKSQVIMGGSMTGPLKTINNLNESGTRIIEDSGTAQWTYTRWRGGFRQYTQRYWDNAVPYHARSQEPIQITVALEQRNTRPLGSGVKITDRPEIVLVQPTVISVAALNPREQDSSLNTNNTEAVPTPNDLSTARPIVLEQPSLPADLEADLATMSH